MRLIPPYCYSDRKRIFGQFAYVSAPTPQCPEAIRIIDGWSEENIVQVDGVGGFHRLAAQQLTELLQKWRQAGHLSLIDTWGEAWSPRYIHGSKHILSPHTWGIAFDILAHGALNELAVGAASLGFYCSPRPWGMHFEVNTLL